MLVLSDIVKPGKDFITFGIFGLIVREVVREYNGEDYAIQSLRWYLEGKERTDGTSHADGDRDQRYPIREANIGALLLRTHLPNARLTGRDGLANLLSWHGTGQGNMTSAFLQSITKSPSRIFFSHSLEQCIQRFTRAQHINDSILAERSDVDMALGQEAPPFPISGFLRLSNCRIYGTASNLLKLLPTSKTPDSWMRTIPSKSSFGARLKEKFGPYWTLEVEAAWRAFLGDLFNQDPQIYIGKHHTWTEGINFIDALKIPGFRKSLTAMQLVNALVFTLILEPPTLEEMSRWIWNHPGLGAYKGLQCLNFVLPTQKAVQVALTCFCNHLWIYCSENIKQILHCREGSVIAAEHFLCKISRWEKKI
ncbi:hypothetical protein BT96DRAFT_824517, partial [Gymnopus androsaceus JB14]